MKSALCTPAFAGILSTLGLVACGGNGAEPFSNAPPSTAGGDGSSPAMTPATPTGGAVSSGGGGAWVAGGGGSSALPQGGGHSSSPGIGGIVPLFDATTTLEHDVHYETADAIVTRFGDRGRDRHAREDQFQSYDHYLPHYWEHRTSRYIFTDHVAKGGST
ncbi:MAG TPA: hypothetical protein VIW29_09330, partial [Polyangiaceae bacterium]